MENSIRKHIYILGLVLSMHMHTLVAEQLITLFLKEYPVFSPPEAAAKLSSKLHKAGKISTHQAKYHIPIKMSGIFATYGGFLTVSNLDGELSFPRKHTHPFIYLLVTQKVTPIVMSGNTIHHWELEEDTPTEMYKMEQQTDSNTGKHYWLVAQEPLPANNRLPLETVVLFADPKYVYVPLGITVYKESPHLILPDIYIKRGINLNATALYLVNLAHYFGAVIPLYKKDKLYYLQHLTY